MNIYCSLHILPIWYNETWSENIELYKQKMSETRGPTWTFENPEYMYTFFHTRETTHILV